MRSARLLVLSVALLVATMACGFSLDMTGSGSAVAIDADLQAARAQTSVPEPLEPAVEPVKTLKAPLEPTDPAEPQGERGTAGVVILEAEMGTGISPGSIDIQEPKDVFEPDEEVYVTLWTSVEGTERVPYRCRWTGPGGAVWLEETATVWTGETGWYLGHLPEGGWEPGGYTVELYFDERLAATWTFQVVQPGDAPTSFAGQWAEHRD